jgi:nitrogen fixation/metabolism regulation signal transduction histidine kinase
MAKQRNSRNQVGVWQPSTSQVAHEILTPMQLAEEYGFERHRWQTCCSLPNR